MTRLETGKERKKNKASRRQGGAGFREGGGPPQGEPQAPRGRVLVPGCCVRHRGLSATGLADRPPKHQPDQEPRKTSPTRAKGRKRVSDSVSPAGRRGLHTVSHGDPRRTFQQETSANSAAKTRNAPPGASRFPPSPPWVPGQQVQKPRPGPRLAGAPRGEGPRVGGA